MLVLLSFVQPPTSTDLDEIAGPGPQLQATANAQPNTLSVTTQVFQLIWLHLSSNVSFSYKSHSLVASMRNLLISLLSQLTLLHNEAYGQCTSACTYNCNLFASQTSCTIEASTLPCNKLPINMKVVYMCMWQLRI